MPTNNSHEIFSARTVNAAIQTVYHAFANPAYLAKWWGPEGFTNTIHEFDLRPEGKWRLTMHGPEKGNYENSSIFKIVEPLQLVRWTRISPPLFDMELRFEAMSSHSTKISFTMLFDTEEACAKIRRFATPNNEENFDRLERLLPTISEIPSGL